MNDRIVLEVMVAGMLAIILFALLIRQDWPGYVLAAWGIIAITGVGGALRRQRRRRMSLEQRRAQEIIPSYRDRIR